MTPEEAAQIMGMKTREVLDVIEVDGGHAVLTKDGRWSLLVDGKFDSLYAENDPPVRAKKTAVAAKKA